MQKQKVRKRVSVFVKAVIVTFVMFSIITIFSQILSFSELDREKQSLEDSIYTTQEKIAELNEELGQTMDDAYIERIARASLNYHLPEEILFFNDLVN